MLATKPPPMVVVAVPVKPNFTPAGAESMVVLPWRGVTNGAATPLWNPVVQSISYEMAGAGGLLGGLLGTPLATPGPTASVTATPDATARATRAFKKPCPITPP